MVFHSIFSREDDDEEVRVQIPGTSRFITTSREQANLLRFPDQQGVADRTGVTDFFQTERGQQRLREQREASGILEGFDVAVATGTDFVLDHPDRSVQDGVRGIISRATGVEDDELAQRARAIDEGITRGIDRRIGGTVFDTRATGAVRSAGDILIGEGIRTFVGAGTGIDTREGDTQARTGAFELADIGLTAGTAGLGRAAVGAARTARSGGPIRSTFRIGDDTGTTAIRLPDDAAAPTTRAADRVTDATRTSDDLLPVVRQSQADEALPVLARATGDATTATSGFVRTTARATDDVGAAATRVAQRTDDLGTGGARLTDRIRDSLARFTDSISTAGARVGSGTRAAATGRPAQLLGGGALLGAGIVGGGALINQLSDRMEMADGTVLVRTDTFPATERFEGGILYRIKEQDGPTVGYSVVVGIQGRNVIMLDSDGQPTRAPLSVEEMQERARGGI